MLFCKTINSMEKILPSQEPVLVESKATMLKNERYHFQIALKEDILARYGECKKIVVRGDIADSVSVRVERFVPSTLTNPAADDYYVSKEACLIPDVLSNPHEADVAISCNQWRGVWVTIYNKRGVKKGKHHLEFDIYSSVGELQATVSYDITVINANLPETDLVLTNWMHYDCISNWYKAPLFGRKFYKIFEGFLKAYTESGFNMLLVPTFTPAFDTKVGTERMTAQLVKVIKNGDTYTFDFTELKKFILFVFKRGIKYLEFAPLFTQWGGTACPKVMATENGVEKRIFGWDVAADSKEYTSFLEQYLSALTAFIDEMNIRKVCYFHLTDEPGEAHIEAYKKCREAVKKHIGDMPIMDAMHDYTFKQKGYVDIPVAGLQSYKHFAEHDIYDIFVYNCCSPVNGYYSNRFVNMPSQRTRVLGMQLYQTGVKGYLHWGFNFYKSYLSVRYNNPYISADILGAYPTGDGHIVYPGEDGAEQSIRSEVINDGFQDYRALKLLESYIGRAEVLALLKEWGLEGYTVYPRDAAAHAAFRDKINKLIRKYKNKKA